MKKLILFPLLLIILTSCNKENFQLKEFIFHETQCSDPWMENIENPNNEEVKSAAREYLEENNICIQKIERCFDPLGVLACLACSCASGNFLVIEAKGKYSEELKELGFKDYP